MIYIKSLFALVCCVIMVTAQIPNFGRCPDYEAMPDFDRESFLGKWYEAERYFAVSELASRCVSVTYERRADGKIYVNNEMTNRFTNVQRIVSGVLNNTAKSDEATFTVKYTGLPVNYDTTLHVLETDYDSYAVVWSCNPLAGPVGHTESVWVLTRERIADGFVLQSAYGVLDKFKISRTFFVKTDQTDCETKADAAEAEDIPDSGYDIVVDDDTVSTELLNHHGHNNPQVNQVQHIAHVQNLQQFSPYLQPHVPQIHHTHGVAYYKQNVNPSEKSALNLNDEAESSNQTKIEQKPDNVKDTEAKDKFNKLKDIIQATTLPIPLVFDATATATATTTTKTTTAAATAVAKEQNVTEKEKIEN